jgi:hypothetical protein
MFLPSEALSTYIELDQAKGSGTKATNRWGDFLRVRPFIPQSGIGVGEAGFGWVLASYFYPDSDSHGGAELHYYEVSSNQDTSLAISLSPASGFVNAGFSVGAGVTVTSLNGIQSAPITMLSEGLINLGSENLSGQTCTFSQPVKVGSICNFDMEIATNATDPTGTYKLSVAAVAAQGSPTALSAIAQYGLTIGPSVAPKPIIVSPLGGANLPV